jgi:hypothetical protein
MLFQDLRRSIQGADHGITRAACMVALAAVTVMACSSCASPTTSGSLGTLTALAQECPSGRSVATLVELDGTGSSQADDILSSRMAIVRDQATKVAVCSGQLRVAVFTSGVSATKVIFDAQLSPQGATQIAQLRRVPELVDAAMTQIEAAYPPAVTSLPQTGTDVTAVFRSGAEYTAQVSAGKSPAPQVSIVVLTDGVQNLGLPLDQTTLTDEQATKLAAGTPTVSLDGVVVTFAGIGRVDGAEPPTSYVEALKVFYRKTCETSRASSCTVVTDYAQGQ